MGFIRVRQAEGPAHEFDISEAAYARNEGAYKVIDSKPVAKSRAAKYVQAKPAETAGKPVGKEATK